MGSGKAVKDRAVQIIQKCIAHFILWQSPAAPFILSSLDLVSELLQPQIIPVSERMDRHDEITEQLYHIRVEAALEIKYAKTIR